MALYQTKKDETARVPVFLKILETSAAGICLEVDSRIPTDLHTIFAGTAVATCGTAGQYMWMKSAVLSTAKVTNTTRIRINGPNPFKVGDYIALEGLAASTAATITAVAATYIVTAQTTYSLAKHEVVYQAAAANATARKYQACGLLQNDVYVRDNAGVTLYNVFGSLVLQGSVLVSNFVWGYDPRVRGKLSFIRFVDQNKV